MDPAEPDVHRVPLREALAFWIRLGFINFGGPTGQIALMHSELVDRRKWIDEPSFLHALNFAMLLPGPEAHQLGIYVGWLMNGSPGAIAAGVFFILPAFLLMVALSWVYAVHGNIAWVSGTFDGLSWAVVGIVAAALIRIGTRALGRPILVALAVLAFLALFVFGVPFPLAILAAGLIGWSAASSFPSLGPSATDLRERERVPPTWGRAVRVLAIGLAVWLVPLAAVVAAAGTESVIAEQALFFAVASLLTFGGAYAALAYVNQAAVVRYGWITSAEMAVGLSLAETTPGPLMLVLVFVGFVGAFGHPGSLPPEVAGIGGAFVAAWATFVPSFVFIFLGAPSVERLRGNVRLSAALSAVTAAVVGVIANLAVVFATSVLFERSTIRTPFGHEIAVPVWSSADLLAIAVAAASFVAIARLRVNVVWVVLAAGLIGLVRTLL